MLIFELWVILVALVIGTYTDFKIREVPDFLNFTLITVGFSIALIKSLLEYDISFFISSLTGFLIAFVISTIMFYGEQWGGGDAKMLMGIAAILGLSFSLDNFFVGFLFNLIIAGAIYGILWGIYLGIINRKELLKEMLIILKAKKIAMLKKGMLIIFSLSILIIIFLPIDNIKLSLLAIIFLLYMTFYFWIYIKAIENVCMIKKVSPSKLTEGDWIVGDIIINKKYIAGKKDLGVSKEQIIKLKNLYSKKKIKEVVIKTGIPFIPSFLISFLITLFYGNILLFLV